jgi:hypothetical protein
MANNEVRRILKWQISLANHAGDFAAAAANSLEQGTPRDKEMTFVSLGNSAYRQGPKLDFSVDEASDELVDFCTVLGAFEMAATPTEGNFMYLYMAWSNDATAANGNPAGASGSDGAYTGYSSDADDAIKQAQRVATFQVVDSQVTANVQIIDGGSFVPRARYGCPILRNESGAATHSDDVETHIVIDGYLYEVQ